MAAMMLMLKKFNNGCVHWILLRNTAVHKQYMLHVLTCVVHLSLLTAQGVDSCTIASPHLY